METNEKNQENLTATSSVKCVDVFVDPQPDGAIVLSCFDPDVDGEGRTIEEAYQDMMAQWPEINEKLEITYHAECSQANTRLMLRAIELANLKHLNQTDKGGEPYFAHVVRVSHDCETDEQRIVGMLHDLLEDTDVTAQQLLDEGFPPEIVDAVLALTRRSDETYEQFIRRAGTNALARRVKIADLIDNMDLLRLKELTETDCKRLMKYHRAWRYLLSVNP